MPGIAIQEKSVVSPVGLGDRIPELDGVRASAIGIIVLAHYFLITYLPPRGSVLAYAFVAGRLAWTGVDLFFVLSGFLIGGILMDARQSTNYFRVFYARRFLRIIPIYAVFLAGNFILFSFIHAGKAPEFAYLTRSELPWAPYVLFIQSFWMAHGNTLGAPALGLTWSLAIEEQFYLTLPMIVRFAGPRRLLQIVVAGIAAAPLLRVSLYHFWPGHPIAWYVLMPCRADSLLLGVLGAIVFRNQGYWDWLKNKARLHRIALYVLVAGAAILTIESPSSASLAMAAGGLTWIGVLYLLFILYVLMHRDGFLSALMRWRSLVWLGSIAYGTYLFHPTALIFLSHRVWPRPLETDSFSQMWVSIVALIVTLGLCRISWLYFEKPLVRIGHRFRYDRIGEA
jgi:peptidoglycan/LPS O-acetylase OafA/YrhL